MLALAATARATPTVSELPAGSGPAGLATGPDGRLWAAEPSSAEAGALAPTGAFTTVGLTPASAPVGVARGQDGNIWLTESANPGRIARVDPSTLAVAEFPTPTANSRPNGITVGPDGNVWFTERSSALATVTPGGTISEHPVPGARDPYAVTTGSDGGLWFTEAATPERIAEMTTSGTVRELGGVTPAAGLRGIAAGPDGRVWFTEQSAGRIGRIAPWTGTVEEFSAGLTPGSAPAAITAGPDGNMWFTESGAARVGRITPGGAITEFAVGATPAQITDGPDGALWFSEQSAGRIGRITPDLAPLVGTGPAEAVRMSAALLVAQVNPRAERTSVHFDYGPTRAYGLSANAGDAGDGNAGVRLTAALNRLGPATTYHYRAVATNASGTTYGDDVSFRTLGAGGALPAAGVWLAAAGRPRARGRTSVAIALACASVVPCNGSARLLVARSRTVAGRRGFSLAPASTTLLVVRLNRGAARLLARRRQLRLRLDVRLADGTPVPTPGEVALQSIRRRARLPSRAG